MARNKYPEETVQLILDTAARLFMEKGYDGTSLQDILEETHLSKGAIYHHFNSKEEFSSAFSSRIGEETEARLSAVRDDPAMNGREKLRALFRASILQPNQQKVLDIAPTCSITRAFSRSTSASCKSLSRPHTSSRF